MEFGGASQRTTVQPDDNSGSTTVACCPRDKDVSGTFRVT